MKRGGDFIKEMKSDNSNSKEFFTILEELLVYFSIMLKLRNKDEFSL